VPQAAKERNPRPDIVVALVNIRNSMVFLARAITELNDYLTSLTDYIEQLEWSKEEGP